MKNIYLFIILFCLAIACSKNESNPPVRPDPPIEKPETKDPPPGPQVSTPAVRSQTQINFSGVSTVLVPKPTEALAGDLLIMIMAKDGAQYSKPSVEEGWVRIVSDHYGSGVPLIRAWWKKVTASDPAEYSFDTGSASNAGRVDLICIKDWNGSAPIALSEKVGSAHSFTTPSIPVISPSGKDLLLTSVAVAAASGLESVVWQSGAASSLLTGQSTSKVTLATASRAELTEMQPAQVAGNTFTTQLPSNRTAAVMSFIIPAASDRPVVRVYRGGAARTRDSFGNSYYLSHEYLVEILSHPSLGYDVRSIGENEVDKITAATMENVDLYIQPGGPTIPVGWPYMAPHKDLIRQYVEDGGKYLGVCLGAYFFRNFYPGQSFDLLPAGNYAYTYNSLEGSTYDGAGSDLVQVNLKDIWGNGHRTLTIVGGCYFYCPGNVPDLTTLATYIQPNQLEPRTAIRFSFNENQDDKKGWVIGIGPHPEARPSWGGLEDPDGVDDDLIIKAAADLLNR